MGNRSMNSPDIQCRVLVVDDDSALAFMTTKFLIAEGMQVDYTIHPKEAAQMLRQSRYHFLLTDMMMPEVTGVELMVWARKHAPHTHTWIMTAAPMEDIRNLALSLGAQMFLPKPLNLERLAQQLKEAQQPGVTGSLKHIGLLDLVQMMSLDHRRRTLVFKVPQSTIQGRIWLAYGQVVHCELDGPTPSQGETAFFELMHLSQGHFSQEPWREPAQRTIHQPLATLAFQAAQEFDETGRPQPLIDIDPELLPAQPLRRMLIVDDDPLNLTLLSKTLQTGGLDIHTADDGRAAMQRLQQERFDLLLSDVQMPGMDGLSLLLWAREHCPHMAVILMTATPSARTEILANAYQSLSFFPKPVDIPRLQALLQALGDRGFQGEVSHIHILDLMQMYLLRQGRQLLQIQDLHSFKRGRIYISNGHILHAEYGNLSGEEAFLKIAATVAGVFFEQDWQEPGTATLADIPIHRLLLRAGQQLQTQASIEPSPDLLDSIEIRLGLGDNA
jgi:CheY-like chemotaxis protein